LVSCLLAAAGPETSSFFFLVLTVPGSFLIASFHVAALFVPGYFLYFGAITLVAGLQRRRLIVLHASIVPFLLFGTAARLGAGSAVEASVATALAAETFSRTGGAILFALFGLLSLFGVRLLGRRFAQSARSARSTQAQAGEAGEPTRSVAGRARLAVTGDAGAAGEPLGESQSGADAEGDNLRLLTGRVEDDDASGRRAGGARAARSFYDSDAPLRLQRLLGEHGKEAGHNGERESARGAEEEAARSDDEEPAPLEELPEAEEAEKAGAEEADAPEEPEEAGDAEEAGPEKAEPAGESREGPRYMVHAGSEAADHVQQSHNGNGHGEELSVYFREGAFWSPEEEAEDAEAAAADEDIELNDGDGGDEAREPAEARGRSGIEHYNVPIQGILHQYEDAKYWEIDEETKESAEVLRVTLEEFQIRAEVTGIRKGPVITMFELLPAPGVKLAKIVNLADNIALRLAASSVRIVAPIPGKHAVGIEIPNKRRHIVSFAELLENEQFTSEDHEIPMALGKDIPGDAQIIDLTKTPHLLIAGATGSGKSVCVNSIICSILYQRRPDQVKMILIDPKIVELKFYNDIPHLLTPVITDPKRAFQALQYLLYEMERRYSLLDSLGVRDVQSYNEKIRKYNYATEPLPYLVVVVDEFADLMSASGKELESTVARLAAMSRAVGIHLVLATQRPSTDVITGLIKANIPSRIAFMVSSKVDSRIIIDSGGAEKLLGQGDMLFTSAWDPFPVRMQGAFLSEDEVERVVEHVKQLGEPEYIDEEIFIDEDEDDDPQQDLEDPLLEKAIDIVVSANKASASYLQRRLKVGYNRAARLVEEMERLGIVGPQKGSKPREILSAPDS
jgi:S-DNA-T family DNA segregation ATPase FtsK/SpoIIIE